MGKTAERRNLRERAAVVRRIINDVINNPSVTLSVETLQVWLDVPVDAARRILARLASSGVVREIQTGVFVRGALPGEQIMWR
jgi:Fic family protein